MLLVFRGLAEQFIQADVDLAWCADITDFKTVGCKAIFHQPALLAADYFLHPVAFPLMLLPWWLERQLREQYSTSFQEDLIISNASLYYYIRLVDNVMDGLRIWEAQRIRPITSCILLHFP